jgi:hypothetical protein
VEAFVEVRLARNALVKVRPVPEVLVVEAFNIVAVPVVFVFVKEAPVAESEVVEATPRVVLPVTSSVPVKLPLPPVKPVAERFVVDAFVEVKFVINPLTNVNPVPDIPVVEAKPKVV